jgi:hypothetical protein
MGRKPKAEEQQETGEKLDSRLFLSRILWNDPWISTWKMWYNQLTLFSDDRQQMEEEEERGDERLSHADP